MKTLIEIKRNGDKYSVVYQVESEKVVNHALPVYTAMGMNGKINKSGVKKVVYSSVEKVVKTVEEAIEETTAMDLVAQARRGDMVAQYNVCNKENWAILLK